MIVRVPATSANLGPGFDALGMALGLHAHIGLVGDDTAPPRHVLADEHHPATVAFRRLGGEGDLWVASPIPMGRGLGYSGAMRVGGALVAAAQRGGGDISSWRAAALTVAAELEGHADNAAASVHGGVVATAGGSTVRVPVALDPAIVAWVPAEATTSTDKSRSALPATVSFADAVHTVGRAALLVAALAAGDRDALAVAVDDRLHQDRRLAGQSASAEALDSGRRAGAWCGWLSGSGPSVALLCDPSDAERIAAALPDTGRALVLPLDLDGATVVDEVRS